MLRRLRRAAHAVTRALRRRAGGAGSTPPPTASPTWTEKLRGRIPHDV